MKKLIQIFMVFGLISIMGGSATGHSEEGTGKIVITVTGMEKTEWRKEWCELKFDITNNAYGTLHRIDARLTGFDDRGRKVDEPLSATASNTKGLTGPRIPIALGSTIKDVGDATFKEECKYLTEIKYDGIDEADCVMRMLPENDSCSKFTTLKSNVPSLKIKKKVKTETVEQVASKCSAETDSLKRLTCYDNLPGNLKNKKCSSINDSLQRLSCFESEKENAVAESKKTKEPKNTSKPKLDSENHEKISGLKSYVQKTYMIPDKVSGHKVSKRFKSTPKENVSLLSGSIFDYRSYKDGIFVIKYDKNNSNPILSSPNSEEYNDNVLSWGRWIMNVNDFIRSYDYKLEICTAIPCEKRDKAYKTQHPILENIYTFNGKSLWFYAIRDIDKNSSEFKESDEWGIANMLSSFVLLNDGKIFSPNHEVLRGSNEKLFTYRELWDIFKYKGEEYILISYHPVGKFEIYQISKENLLLTDSFFWTEGL
jgi:hypothetical protein